MAIAKIWLYVFLAIIAGLTISFGLAGFMHQPLPLQVPVQEYAPASPPAPAVPTIAPANPDTSKFAPAPAPLIVTTQPLPTITPISLNDITEIKEENSLKSEIPSPLVLLISIAGLILLFIPFIKSSGISGMAIAAVIAIIVGFIFFFIGLVMVSAIFNSLVQYSSVTIP